MSTKPLKPQEKAKGAALKKLRKRDNLTQKQFGALLGKGYSRQQVSSWERGFYWPDELESLFEQIFKIAPASFARIGIGVSYPEALKNPLTEVSSPFERLVEKLKAIKDNAKATRLCKAFEELADIAENDTVEPRATVSRQVSVTADIPEPSLVRVAPDKKEEQTGGTP